MTQANRNDRGPDGNRGVGLCNCPREYGATQNVVVGHGRSVHATARGWTERVEFPLRTCTRLTLGVLEASRTVERH